MPDNVWWWVGAVGGALIVGFVADRIGYDAGLAKGTGDGYSNGYVDGLNAGVEQGKAVERARAENIAIATEADRKAAIKLRRSEGARKAWVTRKAR